MGHLSTEQFAAFLDGHATDAEKSDMESHLATCPTCSEMHRQNQAMDRLLREVAEFEAPAHLVDRWKNMFPDGPPGPKSKRPWLQQIIASLVFDTYDQPMMAGVRLIGVPPRQRLYRAGDIDVDVKVDTINLDKQIEMTGQILTSGPEFINNAVVRLESEGLIRYRTRTNPVGEFSFEVPNEAYDLSVEIDGQRIAIYEVYTPLHPLA